MDKYSNKTASRDIIRAATVLETAELTGVSPRHVRRIMAGEQENENVLSTFMEIKERKNLLLQEVKKLIPFA